MPQEEYWLRGERHYREFEVTHPGPNGRVYLTPELDFRGTLAEKACDMFDGKIVLVQNRFGETIWEAD